MKKNRKVLSFLFVLLSFFIFFITNSVHSAENSKKSDKIDVSKKSRSSNIGIIDPSLDPGDSITRPGKKRDMTHDRIIEMNNEIKEIRGEIKSLLRQIKKSSLGNSQSNSIDNGSLVLLSKITILQTKISFLQSWKRTLTKNHFVSPEMESYFASYLECFECNGSGKFRIEEGSYNGDGTKANPFGSITEALDYAKNMGLCEVEIMVGSGTYQGNLTITRNTTIWGDNKTDVFINGSIENISPYDLTIRNATIINAGERGAIVVSNPKTATTLFEVAIHHAEGYGIRQNGGSIAASKVTVFWTKRLPGELEQGTGIYLSGGVTGWLNDFYANFNESGGLVIEGDETHIVAYNLHAEENLSNSYFLDTFEDYVNTGSKGPGFAAVEARDSATLLVDGFTIKDNQTTGVFIHSGAKAHFRNGKVTGTDPFPVMVDDVWYGGTNIIITRAFMELHNFQCTFASLTGLAVFYYSVAIYDGVITDNVVGIHVHPQEGMEYGSIFCYNNSDLFNNSVNLQSEHMPIPNAGDVIDQINDYGNISYDDEGNTCLGVPWE